MADERTTPALDELAERRAAKERVVRVGEQLLGVMATWRTAAPSEAALFKAAWDDLWVEHRAATLRSAELGGGSVRLAELQWREWRANFRPVDPAVALTEADRAELCRLELALQAEVDDLKRRAQAMGEALRLVKGASVRPSSDEEAQ